MKASKVDKYLARHTDPDPDPDIRGHKYIMWCTAWAFSWTIDKNNDIKAWNIRNKFVDVIVWNMRNIGGTYESL